jgi:hypothetical protein
MFHAKGQREKQRPVRKIFALFALSSLLRVKQNLNAGTSSRELKKLKTT